MRKDVSRVLLLISWIIAALYLFCGLFLLAMDDIGGVDMESLAVIGLGTVIAARLAYIVPYTIAMFFNVICWANKIKYMSIVSCLFYFLTALVFLMLENFDLLFTLPEVCLCFVVFIIEIMDKVSSVTAAGQGYNPEVYSPQYGYTRPRRQQVVRQQQGYPMQVRQQGAQPPGFSPQVYAQDDQSMYPVQGGYQGYGQENDFDLFDAE